MVPRERRDAIIRRQAEKLAHRIRRDSIMDCKVQMDPRPELLPPPFRKAAPWIARILAADDHEILLSAEGLRISSRDGTVELDFDRVSSWEWLARRTRNKLRDGTRIAVRMSDGRESIVHAPGWSWPAVHCLFSRLFPHLRADERSGGLQTE